METMIANEPTQTLHTDIETLPFQQRPAPIRRQFEALDDQVIASNLACSLDTARVRFYRARRQLSFVVARYDPDIKENAI